MWAGDDWPTIHKELALLADCKAHKHAILEDMKLGIWDKIDKEIFGKWVRRKVMDPFLFMDSYGFGTFNLWAKAAGLLPKESSYISDGRVDTKTKEAVILMDTVAFYLPWMMQFLLTMSPNCQQTREMVVQNKRKAGDLQKCILIDDANKCIRQNELYKIFKKFIPGDIYNEKMLTASFCITFVTWHLLVDQDWYHTLHELGSQLTEQEEELKKLGNTEYKDGLYLPAVASYTKVVKNRKDNAIIYGNRAQAYLKLAKYDEAEMDGRRVIVLDPVTSKGYVRVIKAKEGLEDYHRAHLVATFGQELCSEANNFYRDLYDLNSELQEKCNKEGACSKQNRYQHEVDIPKVNGTADVPDLLSSGEDEVSEDESSTQSVNQVNNYVPETRTRMSSISSVTPEPPAPPVFQYTLGELLRKLKELQQEGSKFLLSDLPHDAAIKFLEAQNILPELAAQNYEIDEEDKVCLLYALGMAYQGGPKENWKNSVELFQTIITDHQDLNFTPALSAIAQSYIKLYRFEQALEQLQLAQEVLERDRETLYKTYNWPATNKVIPTSIPDKQKDLIVDLIHECQYPPTPVAVCRSDTCLLPTKNIYQEDPDFKGYHRLYCETNCRMEYHPACWKRVKEALDKNKGLVGQLCLTPDCGQPVTCLERYDQEGNLINKTGETNDQLLKQRKTKLEKKFNQKELRKQQKRKERTPPLGKQASVDETGEPNPLEAVKEDEIPQAPPLETTAIAGDRLVDSVDNPAEEPNNNNKEINSNKANTPVPYEVNAEPSYVIKKGDDHYNEKNPSNNTHSNPAEKRKKAKTKKVSTVSVDEFCADVLENIDGSPYYSQYLKRVHDLQTAKNQAEEDDEELWPPLISKFPWDAESPFYIPENLRDNPEELERVLSVNTRSTFSRDTEEEIQIRDAIFTYMEDFLKANGPIQKDSQNLRDEISCFPGPAQALISKYNGLICFLKQSVRFTMIGDMLCATSTNDQPLMPTRRRQENLEAAKAMDIKSIKGGKLKRKEEKPGTDSYPSLPLKTVEEAKETRLRSSSPASNKSNSSVTKKKVKEEKAVVDQQVSQPPPVVQGNVKPKAVAILPLNVMPEVVEFQPSKLRSNSLESNHSNSSLNNCNVDNAVSKQTLDNSASKQALNSIRKLTKSFSEDLQVTVFKLQVSISALALEDQQQIVCAVINSVKGGLSDNFWEDVNKRLDLVKVHLNNSTTDNDKNLLEECEQLRLSNSNLEERLSATMDTLTKLQKSQVVSKTESEEQIADLKQKNLKLQAGMNAAQARLESEKQSLQNERQRLKEEAAQLRAEKEGEVKTASLLLTKVTEENQQLKTLLDKEKDANSQLQNSISLLLESCENTSRQAQIAKESFVQLIRKQGLKNLETELTSARKSRMHLMEVIKKEEENPSMTSSVYEMLVEKPLQGIETYMQELKKRRATFLELVNKHIEALQDGQETPDEPLELPTLPPKPESIPQAFAPNLGFVGNQSLRQPLLPQPGRSSPSSTMAQPKPLPQMLMPTNFNYFNGNPGGPQPSLPPNLFSQNPLTSTTSTTFSPQPLYQRFAQPNFNPQHPLLMNSQTQMNSASNFGPATSVNSSILGYPHVMPGTVPTSQEASLNVQPNLASQSKVNVVPLTTLNSVSSPVPQAILQLQEQFKAPSPQPAATSKLVQGDLQSANFVSASRPVTQQTPVPNMASKAPPSNMTRVAPPPGMTSLAHFTGLTSQHPAASISTLPSDKSVDVPILTRTVDATGTRTKLTVGPARNPLLPTTTLISAPQQPASVPAAPQTAGQKSSYDKLIRKLQESHPMMTSVELENYVGQFRSQRDGRLSGLSIDKITEGVSSLIQRVGKQEAQKARVITPLFEKTVAMGRDQISRRLAEGAMGDHSKGGAPWRASGTSGAEYKGSDDNTCSICLENMLQESGIHKTECKHRFHFKCIEPWLKKNSKCPNCNSHILLSTEYPPLGS